MKTTIFLSGYFLIGYFIHRIDADHFLFYLPRRERKIYEVRNAPFLKLGNHYLALPNMARGGKTSNPEYRDWIESYPIATETVEKFKPSKAVLDGDLTYGQIYSIEEACTECNANRQQLLTYLLFMDQRCSDTLYIRFQVGNNDISGKQPAEDYIRSVYKTATAFVIYRKVGA